MKNKKKTFVTAIIILLLISATVLLIHALNVTGADEILKGIVGVSEIPEGADVNGDGEVDVLDVIAKMRQNDGGPRLETLSVDGYELTPSFSPDVFNYTVSLPGGHPKVPGVTGTCASGLELTSEQAYIPANENTGNAVLTVSDGSETSVYRVSFIKDSENGITLQYDDRYVFEPTPVSGGVFVSSDPEVVSVDENGVLTALDVSDEPVTVSYGTPSDTQPETLVVSKVEKAVVNLFFVTGQSNANGCYDLANDRGELQYTIEQQIAAVEMPDMPGQVYSYNALINRYAKAASVTDHGFDTLYDMALHANNGFASALGKKYYELSGEKVVFLQTALNATAIEVWLKPGRTGSATWGSAKNNLYQKTYDAYNDLMTNYLTSDKFEIHHVANFWLQGETCQTTNFNPNYYSATGGGSWGDSSYLTVSGNPKMTDEQYYNYYRMITEDMHNDFGVEMQGIMLVRTVNSVASAESKTLQLLSDIVPVKSAQYTLHNQNTDTAIVSRAANIVTKRDAADKTNPGYGLMGMDNVHYNQVGYNYTGRVAGENIFNIFNNDTAASSVELLDCDGRTKLSSADTLKIKEGDQYRVAAMSLPEYSNKNITYSSSDESVFTVTQFGCITGVSEGDAVLYATSSDGKSASVNISVWNATAKPVSYRWDFNDLTSTVGDNGLTLSPISKLNTSGESYSIADGIMNVTKKDFVLDKPITLSTDNDFSVEWRAKLRGGSIFFATEDASLNGYNNVMYDCYTTASSGYQYGLRMQGSNGTSFTLPFGDSATARAYNTVWNTFKVEFKKSTGMIGLYVKNGDAWDLITEKALSNFKARFTNMFGRYNKVSLAGANGEFDYIEIHTYEPPKEFTTTVYEWEFNGNLNEKKGLNSLTMSELSQSNGASYSFVDGCYYVPDGTSYEKRPDFVFSNPIRFIDSGNWTIDWTGYSTSAYTILGETSALYPFIYNAHSVAGAGNSLRFFSKYSTAVVDLKFGTFKDYNKVMNTWKLAYTCDDNMLTLYFLDPQSLTYETVASAKAGQFDITYTNLFGRYNDAGMGNFCGKMDHLKITIDKLK